jgi:hypothetical protein
MQARKLDEGGKEYLETPARRLSLYISAAGIPLSRITAPRALIKLTRECFAGCAYTARA